MFKQHEACNEPSADKLIWRYMDMAKYVSLITRKQLFFCRATKFDDPFEGDLSRVTQADLMEWYLSDIPLRKRTPEDIEQAQKKLSDYVGFMKRLKHSTTINSWHQNDHENFAMWKIYSNWNSGLAVVTNFGRAREALNKASEFVYGGLVNYIEEEKEVVNQGNTFNHFMTKRSQFSYENEVRFIHELRDKRNNSNDPVDGLNGIYIDIELTTLINKIYIAPQAGQWLKDALIDINRKYGIDVEIMQSSFFGSEQYR